MNNEMKSSIARRLSLRISAVLAIALMVLLAGAFFVLNREVNRKGREYTGIILSIYGDISTYMAYHAGSPVDIRYSERLSFFGDYLCSWYDVDYVFVYVPDFENNTITYLSVTKNKKKFGDQADDHMVGHVENYVLTDNELEVWNNGTGFAVEKKNRFGLKKSTDIMMPVTDNFGNKLMYGASCPVDSLRSEILRIFSIIAVFLLTIVVLVAGHLYVFIKGMVSNPARRISERMNDFITGGRRSEDKLEINGDDEFAMMAGAFNHMTEEMDRYVEDIARLGREHERSQAEVDIASEIQKGILPSGNASLGNCGIKAVMKPAKYIGGDLYDYLELDTSHTMIAVADVSGKGIPSAMLMAMTITLIRQFAKMGCSPATILKKVNDTFAEENPQMMFVTAFVAIYDSDKDLLTYANAGHNPPYLIHDTPLILDGQAGTPLGLFAGEEYADVEVKLVENDSVFLYTDGVNEAVNSSGEFYGIERLEEVLKDASSSEKKFFVEHVEEALREFVGDAEQKDDITMLALRARKSTVLELDYDVSEFSAIRERIISSGLPKQLVLDLCVAAEECFVNICSYAFDGPAPEGEKILFFFEYSNKVVMRFSDGGRRFDPRNNLPDIDDYDIDTAVGGLGRLIAFTVADSVDYEYKDGRNVLTIKKSIKQ